MRPRSAGTRSGFTLIELLAVIAIIGVLASLLIVVVTKMMNKGPDLLDSSDISNLAVSVNNFKAKYGTYPPSRIILYPNFGFYNTKNVFEAESLNYINQIWPRLSMKQVPFVSNNSFYGWQAGPPADPVIYKKNNYQWVPNVNTPNGGYTLEGDQCLVFFLGGPALTVNGVITMQGFSTNPQDPCGAGTDRVSFYQFLSARLRDPINKVRNGLLLQPSHFPSYLNNWARTEDPVSVAGPCPTGYFAYFSSGKRKNGYNSGGAVSHEIAALDNVGPYYDAYSGPDAKGNYTITNYLNPTTFQIISAGQDGFFTNYNPDPPKAGLPVLAALPYPMSSPKLAPQRCYWKVGAVSGESTDFWKDNRSNFSASLLYVP